LEGDRIPQLKGHGQALEQKHCFPGIFSDGCDASTNLLNEFDGQAVPCACCLLLLLLFYYFYFYFLLLLVLLYKLMRGCFRVG